MEEIQPGLLLGACVALVVGSGAGGGAKKWCKVKKPDVRRLARSPLPVP